MLLFRLDAGLAKEVRETDNEVDTLHKNTYISVIQKVQEIPDQTENFNSMSIYISLFRTHRRLCNKHCRRCDLPNKW